MPAYRPTDIQSRSSRLTDIYSQLKVFKATASISKAISQYNCAPYSVEWNFLIFSLKIPS